MTEQQKNLFEQMAEALRSATYITNFGDRLRAYSSAKVSLANIPDKDWREADQAALSHELSRRVSRG